MRSTLPSPTDTARHVSGTVDTDITRPEPFARLLPWLLLISGLLGATAAFVLIIEKMVLLTDAAYVPSCSINPILNCGSIMRTSQAEAFGFPNPLIGLAAFPVLAATGAAFLAGPHLRRWYWLGLQTGATLGLAFVGWLIFQSLYRISALCPYCMVVWAVTIPTFWYVTLTNLTRGHLGASLRDSVVTQAIVRNHAVILTVAYLSVAALITHKFWDYWSTLIG